MENNIIDGVFLLAASLIGGLLTIFAGRSSAELERLRQGHERSKVKIDRLLRQIEAYHLLEDLYAQEASQHSSNVAPRSIKTKFRDLVVEIHQCDRPEMTATEARKRLQDP